MKENILFIMINIFIKELALCLKHFYNLTNLLCERCDTDNNYYCIDNNKEICQYIPPENIDLYYEIENIDYSCIEKCSKKYSFYLKYNRNECTIYAPNTKKMLMVNVYLKGQKLIVVPLIYKK